MSNINLTLSKSVFAPYALKHITDYSHRWELWYGGAGSAKSYSITQKLIIRACGEKLRILVCRRYGTTLRNSCFSLFKEIIAKWQLTENVKINESDMRIRFPNGSEIIFLGLDEETKLLSINDISVIWCEEVWEIPKEIVDQLNLRLRTQNPHQQIIMSWNPISTASWLYDFCEINPPKDCIKIHSTYKDNPFLPQSYIDALEELKITNPKKAKVYCYGEWGSDVDGLVFNRWREDTLDINALAKIYQHRVGMDFGYNDPSAIVSSLYDKDNKRIYVIDEFYKTGQTLDALYAQITKMCLTKSKIWCDSAEPRTIEYFKRKHINAVPCIKGQNSVEARIAFLQNHEIIVDKHCTSVIMELSNFAYQKDKQTGKYIDGKYTHEYSHSLDALGYSYSDIYAKGNIRTLDKSVLGI